MGVIFDTFNDRELAWILWTSIVVAIALAWRPGRQLVRDLAKILLSAKFMRLFLMMGLYIVLILVALKSARL